MIRHLLIAALVMGSISTAAGKTLHYNSLSEAEPWTPYIKEVIAQALKAGDPSTTYRLEPCKKKMVQARALETLRKGRELDIYWTMTSKTREQGLGVIRIPLLKGMLGQRLVVIRKADKEKFHAIATMADAKAFSYGQGHDWPDADILESAGFKVARSAQYKKLMQMLDKNRFDAFPLGMNEIWAEVEKRPQLNVMVDTKIVLSYKAPVFLFLKHSDTELQNTLRRGLDLIIKNKTLDGLFNRYYKDPILRTDLSRRLIFKLDNPFMSSETKAALDMYSDMLLVK
ncbi:MAG: ABC transporter substrate-binding protein [Desulfobacter sp.]|nr:MAG: ABC transporter substrate-binding protein [Desulfobacter sp.]